MAEEGAAAVVEAPKVVLCPWGILDSQSKTNPLAADLSINNQGKKKLSYAEIAKDRLERTVDLAILPMPTLRGNIPTIKIPSKSVEKGMDYFKFALITRIEANGRKMEDIKAGITDLWSNMKAKVSPLGKGYLIAKFEQEDDFQKVKFGGPWRYGKQLLRVQDWVPNFNIERQKHSNALVWVKFPGLSMEYWELDVLMAMGRTIGTPIHVDRNTQRRDNGFYASVLVDVDLSKAIPDRILVEVEDKNLEFWQEVQLGVLLEFCNNCKVVGHQTVGCRFLSPVVVTEEVKGGEAPKQVTTQSKMQKKRMRKKGREQTSGDSEKDPVAVGSDRDHENLENEMQDLKEDQEALIEKVDLAEDFEPIIEEEQHADHVIVEGFLGNENTIVIADSEMSKENEGSTPEENAESTEKEGQKEEVVSNGCEDPTFGGVEAAGNDIPIDTVEVQETIQGFEGIEEITEGHLQEPVAPTTSLVIDSEEQESGDDDRFSSPLDVEIVPDSQLEVVKEANVLLNRLKENKQEKMINKRQLVAKIGKKKVALLPPGPFKDKCTAAMSPPE